MSRHKDSILGSTRAYAQQQTAPMVNLALGGQNGYTTDFRFFHSNAPYVRRNLIAKLIEAPRGFTYLQNADDYVAALKALVEMHAQTWEGLNRTLTVNSVEVAVGGAQEVQQTPSNVVRARSEPSMTVPDKYGLPVQALLEGWITNLIGDPDTKVPGIALQGGNIPTDLLPDIYSMTMLFFEPDPTFTKVQKAWLVGNMYPTTGGENTGRRDKTADGEELVHTIQWTGMQQVGLAVNQFAQKYFDAMNKTGTNPNLKPAFVDAIDADVLKAQYGYTEQINEAARTYIRP